MGLPWGLSATSTFSPQTTNNASVSSPRRHNSWPQLGLLLCISVLLLVQEDVYLVSHFLYVYLIGVF